MVLSEQCSAFSRGGEPATLDPRIELLGCGPALTPSSAAGLLIRAEPDHVMICSWWFSHPRVRSQPEVFLPIVRDYLPKVPISILVDDLFVPFPYSYNTTVDAGSVSLVGVCGAQTMALAAAGDVDACRPLAVAI